MGKEPEIPDKLWTVVLIKLQHIEHICNGQMNIHNFNNLRETVGILRCLQYKFEA